MPKFIYLFSFYIYTYSMTTKCLSFETETELVLFIRDELNNDWTKIKLVLHNVHNNRWYIFYMG